MVFAEQAAIETALFRNLRLDDRLAQHAADIGPVRRVLSTRKITDLHVLVLPEVELRFDYLRQSATNVKRARWQSVSLGRGRYLFSECSTPWLRSSAILASLMPS
jgi:hypothetical protein